VKWTQIFALNRADILDPNRIASGQELKMPVPFRPAGP
jgi:nucleoid-associated protein YgaU